VTTDELWIALATAVNSGDEQLARQLVAGTDRVLLEAMLLELANEHIFIAWTALIDKGDLDPQVTVAHGLQAVALDLAGA
jgi:hypothetical protein